MTDREIMQQALTVLKAWDAVAWRTLDTIEGLEAALAQPEPQVCCGDYEKCMKACTPRGRWLAENELAQPEQEPVAKHVCNLWINPETSFYEVDRCTHPINEVFPVYTAPPRKEWVGLTDDEIKKIMQQWRNGYIDIKDVEQLLKEKNT
jgi:hypothetical protein